MKEKQACITCFWGDCKKTFPCLLCSWGEKLHKPMWLGIDLVPTSFPLSVDDAFKMDELIFKCPECGWSGKATISGFDENDEYLMDCCPECRTETEPIGTPSWDVYFYCWPENQVPF